MSTNSRPAARPVVFYDGGCSLCSREIAHYRTLDRGHRVAWIDINSGAHLLNALGLSREQAMRRLHVLDGDGVMRDGAAAFVALWRALPYYRVLAWVVDQTRAVGLLDAAYDRFAAWRYRRRQAEVVCFSSANPAPSSLALQPVPVRGEFKRRRRP